MSRLIESRIDSSLSPEERRVLLAYSDSKQSGLGRAVRLSIQYALGTGIFVAVCILQNEPLWVLVVWGTFLVFMAIRVLKAKKLAGIMPSIIAKYEARIAELENS